MKTFVFLSAVYAILLCLQTVQAEEVEKIDKTEQTTEFPIADLGLLNAKNDQMQSDSAKQQTVTTNTLRDKTKADSQQHTIADFIIHPLIALKPRLPEALGKQANVSSTTASPWQLFGFNSGQGLGSSVSSLAGSVTGWLGNRIQLPSLVETPVRETITTSTTTTTARPEVVVRVKQRGSTKKPIISIKGDNERPYRRTKRPNRYSFNHLEDSEEQDDKDFYDDEEQDGFNNQRKRYQNDDEEEEEDEEQNDYDEDNDNNNEYEEDNNDDDDDDHQENEEEDDEEEEELKPVKQISNRLRNPRPINNNNNSRRRNIYNNYNNNQRKRLNYHNNSNKNSRIRNQQQQQESKEEVAQYDNDEEEEEDEEDEELIDQHFYHKRNQASKRSQTEKNFIQRGQQSLVKQIKQFTGGQTPAEIEQKLRKRQKSAIKKRRNQATLVIKRNGQAIYVAPELLQVADTSKAGHQQISRLTSTSSHYPQPPLTIPYRRKDKPTQYITIPWSQLGISPPNELNALTDGVQSQPLILNISQKAIDSLQYQRPGKKRPQALSPEAVPLLAEASIMDIFKPPRIPPARTPSTAKPAKKIKTPTPSQATSIVIATKTKVGPQRIRPGTIVEKAPAEDTNQDEKLSSGESATNEDSQLIVIGDDESGETRQLSRHAYKQILEYFNSRTGRQLNTTANPNREQVIPVKVISAEETLEETPKIDEKMDTVIEMAKTAQDQAAVIENATQSSTNI